MVMDDIDKTFEKLSVRVTCRPAERILGSTRAALVGFPLGSN